MFSIKRSNTLPVLSATLQDEKRIPVDLTNATTVTMKWRLQEPVNSKVYSGVCSVLAPATDGKVEYTWAVGDTKYVGEYFAEFEIVFANGDMLNVPNDSFAEFSVKPSL